MTRAAIQVPAEVLPKGVVFEQERHRFSLGIPAIGLLVVYVLVGLVFAPKAVSGGLDFVIWGLVLVGLIACVSLPIALAYYYAFGKSKVAGNVVFCGFMAIKLFTLSCLLVAMPHIEARRKEIQEARQQEELPYPMRTAMPMPGRPAPRTGVPNPTRPADKPPPVIKVRKSN